MESQVPDRYKSFAAACESRPLAAAFGAEYPTLEECFDRSPPRRKAGGGCRPSTEPGRWPAKKSSSRWASGDARRLVVTWAAATTFFRGPKSSPVSEPFTGRGSGKPSLASASSCRPTCGVSFRGCGASRGMVGHDDLDVAVGVELAPQLAHGPRGSQQRLSRNGAQAADELGLEELQLTFKKTSGNWPLRRAAEFDCRADGI